MTFATKMRFLIASGELTGLKDLTIGPVKFVFKKPLPREQAYRMFGYMLELQNMIPDEMSLGICINIAAYLTDSSISYAVRPRYDKNMNFDQNMRSILSTRKLRKAIAYVRDTKTCDGVPWLVYCEEALSDLNKNMSLKKE